MNREQLHETLFAINQTCEDLNKEIIAQNPNSKLRFEVLQFSDIANNSDIVYKITEFYNQNWTGNKDFMHIPNFEQVLDNCLNFPVIIAREEGKNDILAMSTIKYDENSDENTNPYFPEANSKYFSMTGVLVKHNSPYKGLGKRIYEIGIRSLYEYNKKHPDSKIMWEIDCRNIHSMSALAAAARSISDKELYGKDKELPLNMSGYYLLKDENGNIIEAPTFIFVTDLNEQEKTKYSSANLEYQNTEMSQRDLFCALVGEIEKKCSVFGISESQNGMDGNSIVQYYPLKERININSLSVEPNNTADNNNREPQDSQAIRHTTSVYISPDDLITVRDIVKSDMKYKISKDKTDEVKQTIEKLLSIWKGIGER